MIDREKVIKGLECHQIDKDHRINCSDCPYHCDEFMNGLNELHNDAIALLKEQENCENCAIAIEDRQPIVRCKDCVKRGFDDCPVNGWMPNKTDGDWFCADGERKPTQTNAKNNALDVR